MKTYELIDWLARGAGPTESDPALRRLAPLLLGGIALAALLALSSHEAVLTSLWAEPAYWFKLGLAAAATLLGLGFALALGRPLTAAHRLRAPRRTLGLGLGLVFGIGAVGLLLAPPGQLPQVWLGHSWWYCPLAVLGCAMPALAMGLWVLRGLGPTRLRAAGAAAGLLAGGCGALGYALVCNEISLAFVATWYVLGIAAVSGLGALLGPRLLRW
ncbi:MAG: DUF1109 domain-containing protein [Burkholderiales bacterium]|nr:DUF1109 domain-containing protein [Burkholderiales bacterium]